MEQNVIKCEGDQKKLFSLIHSLFGSKKITLLAEYTSSFTLKIHNIKMKFPLLTQNYLSSIINIILRIVNRCFSPGDFPASCKSAIISPLILRFRKTIGLLQNGHLFQKLLKKLLLPKYIVI